MGASKTFVFSSDSAHVATREGQHSKAVPENGREGGDTGRNQPTSFAGLKEVIRNTADADQPLRPQGGGGGGPGLLQMLSKEGSSTKATTGDRKSVV